MPPAVSVIIPNYNHAPYLRQRINSVLDQQFTDFEVILLDDNSSDNSREVIEEYRHDPRVSHIVLNDINSGSTFAQWKRGLALAQGRYVWIAESDDYAAPDFLSALVPLLESDPQAAMAFSGSHMVDKDGNGIPGMDWDRWHDDATPVVKHGGRSLILSKLLFNNGIYNASMVVFRRSMAPEIKQRQLRMCYCGDWLFWSELAQQGAGIEVRRKLNFFRQHNAKVSPGASKSGLYFIEGIPVMERVAGYLGLNSTQRAIIAGRILKRLRKYPGVMTGHGQEIMAALNRLSAGASSRRHRLMAMYELDKLLNFAHLRP